VVGAGRRRNGTEECVGCTRGGFIASRGVREGAGSVGVGLARGRERNVGGVGPGVWVVVMEGRTWSLACHVNVGGWAELVRWCR
jgi:hypothetical protein